MSTDRTESVARLTNAVLVGCAVVVTALVVRRELFTPPAAAAEAAPVRDVNDWRAYAVTSHRAGPTPAAVTLVEFSDFQCGYCQRLSPAIAALREKYPQAVAHVFRHFPLTRIHSHAFAAALASECAARQGAFQRYHDALYAGQDSIGAVSWTQFARTAGVPNVPAFDACVRDSATADVVRADIAAGTRLGVKGTPGLLVNGHFVQGFGGREQLEALVEQEIHGAR